MSNTRDSVDYAFRQSGLGNLSDAIANTFYGFNAGLTGNPVPYNTENHGLTFITRPRLNLTSGNISFDRRMALLDSDDPRSIPSAIRAYLDPVGDYKRRYNVPGKSSELVDPYNAFIPLLSNLLLSINGWPDLTVGTYTSKPGVYRETWSMVDDIPVHYGDYELTANFRNIRGDPITAMMFYWCMYMGFVYTGKMMPYPDAIVENEIDYVSRIYRVTLDQTMTYVQKIAATGYAFPTASPIGASMNYNSDTPFNSETATQVSIPFKCQGFMWNDPLLVYSFNRTVCMFNPAMYSDRLKASNSLMVKLNPLERTIMRGLVYPRIDPRTMEMQWYAQRSDYDAVISKGLPDKIDIPSFGLESPPAPTPKVDD